MELVGGLEHFLLFHILGISSSQLTFTFFRGVAQAPTREFPNYLDQNGKRMRSTNKLGLADSCGYRTYLDECETKHGQAPEMMSVKEKSSI